MTTDGLKTYTVKLSLDEALQPLQCTVSTKVGGKVVTFTTFDAGPFDDAAGCLKEAINSLPVQQRLV